MSRSSGLIWATPVSLPRILMRGAGLGWPGFGLTRPRVRLISSSPSLGSARGPTIPSPPAVGAISPRDAFTGSGPRGRRLSWRRLSAGMAPSARKMPPRVCWTSSAKSSRPLLLVRPDRLRLPPCLLGLQVGLARPTPRVPPPLGAVVGGMVRLLRALLEPPLGSVSPRADTSPPWGLTRWPLVRIVRLTGLPPSRLGSSPPAASPGSCGAATGWRVWTSAARCALSTSFPLRLLWVVRTPPGRLGVVSADPSGLTRRCTFGWTQGPI